jgi:hypothetical protein
MGNYVGSMFSFLFFPCLRPFLIWAELCCGHFFHTQIYIYIYNRKQKKRNQNNNNKKKSIKKKGVGGGLANHPSALFSSSLYFV